MGDWYVDKGIDLSLILTVLICTASVLISVVKGWSGVGSWEETLGQIPEHPQRLVSAK